MATLMELCGDALKKVRPEKPWIVRFAYGLKMDIEKARKLFDEYGAGYIYTSSGIVVRDTPQLRRRMAFKFGKCVIIDKMGIIFKYTPMEIKRTKDLINALNAKRERDLKQREIMEFRKKKRLERMFEDMQTQPCPKRQGKANSRADIGKYVNAPYRHRQISEVSRIVRPAFDVITL